MRKSLILITAYCSLAGCASVPDNPLVFIRTDGQPIRGNAGLMQQAEIDRTVCIGQTQQSAAVAAPIYAGGLTGALMQSARNGELSDVAKGCMAQKGYVLVRESQIDEMQKEYARTAAQRAKLKS